MYFYPGCGPLVAVNEEQSQEEKLLTILGRTGTAGMTAREAGQMAHLKRDKIETLLGRLEGDGLIGHYKPEGCQIDRYRRVEEKT